MAKMSIPTKAEIAKLPVVARVAFAARCARRVQPSFTVAWTNAPEDHVRAIETALARVEHYTRAPRSETIIAVWAARAAACAAKAASHAVIASRYATTFGTRVDFDDAAADAINANSYAARVSTYLDSANNDNIETAAARYADVADDDNAVDDAFRAIAIATTIGVTAAIRRDLDLLLHASKTENWTDDTPVPPEFFGPMWPDGPPEGWPEEEAATSAPPTLKVEIQVPAGMDEQRSKEFNQRVARLFAEMSALHVAMGGNGLRIIDDASATPVPDDDELPIGVGDPDRVEIGGNR